MADEDLLGRMANNPWLRFVPKLGDVLSQVANERAKGQVQQAQMSHLNEVTRGLKEQRDRENSILSPGVTQEQAMRQTEEARKETGEEVRKELSPQVPTASDLESGKPADELTYPLTGQDTWGETETEGSRGEKVKLPFQQPLPPGLPIPQLKVVKPKEAGPPLWKAEAMHKAGFNPVSGEYEGTGKENWKEVKDDDGNVIGYTELPSRSGGLPKYHSLSEIQGQGPQAGPVVTPITAPPGMPSPVPTVQPQAGVTSKGIFRDRSSANTERERLQKESEDKSLNKTYDVHQITSGKDRGHFTIAEKDKTPKTESDEVLIDQMINGKTPEIRSRAKAILDEKLKRQLLVAGETARERGAGFADSRLVHVFDTQSYRSTPMSYGDFKKANAKEPNRYIDMTGLEKEKNRLAVINDIEGSIAEVKDSLETMTDKDFNGLMNNALFAKVFTAEDAMAHQRFASAFLNSQFFKALSPPQRTYSIRVFQLREQMLGWRTVIGSGQSSESQRSAIMAAIPGPHTPDKKYALEQLEEAKKPIGRIKAFVMNIPPRQEYQGQQGVTPGKGPQVQTGPFPQVKEPKGGAQYKSLSDVQTALKAGQISRDEAVRISREKGWVK